MLIPSVTESKANRGEAASLTHRDLLSRYAPSHIPPRLRRGYAKPS